MELLLIASFCAAALVVAYRVGERGPQRSRAVDWESAAAACRLERVVKPRRFGDLVLEGTREGLLVRLQPLSGALSGRPGTRVAVTGLAPELSIGPAAVLDASQIAVGDPLFDRATQVWGTPLEIQASLDVETRVRLLRLLATPQEDAANARLVSIGGGTVVFDCWDSPGVTRASRLAAAIDEALALAGRLAVRDAPEERVAASVRNDPVGGVRMRSLKLLMSERPDHPATRDALRAALESDDDELRLVAALAADPEGLTVLRLIAASASSTDEARAQAVARLRDDLDDGEVKGILAASIETRRDATAAACFEVLIRRGSADLDRAARVLAEGPRALMISVVRALGSSGAADAEPLLLGALAHADQEVFLAAIEALGRIGTVAAVPALRRTEARLSSDGELVRTVNSAIAAIQSRLVGADHGQIALASGTATGEVSLAQDEDARGRVSQEES